MSAKDRLICVGVCAGAFGVRGEVKIKSFTATAKHIFKYGPLLSEDGTVLLTVRGHRAVKGGFAARCEEVQTREDAQALKSVKLYVRRSALPPPGDDEFYNEDLIGLRALSEEGKQLGTVVAIHEFGAGPMIEIRTARGASFFHPFTKSAVPTIDLSGGQLKLVDVFEQAIDDSENEANGRNGGAAD